MSAAASEAQCAFGDGDVYVEELLPDARHIEVQIIGDGTGEVSHLWERECSAAAAPSENRRDGARAVAVDRMRAPPSIDAALRIAGAAHYRSLGTFEFLVEGADTRSPRIVFIEANPRLQVEHTVTEEVTGVDLVKAQIRIAGAPRCEICICHATQAPKPRGYALQARVNMETMTEAGDAKPAGGTLTAFAPPNGPGVRVDTFGYAGYTTSPNYDSLLAKVIVHSASNEFADVLTRARRALGEFRSAACRRISRSCARCSRTPTWSPIASRRASSNSTPANWRALQRLPRQPALPGADARNSGLAGARVDSGDPLAVLTHGKSEDTAAEAVAPDEFVPDGSVALRAPLQGTIISIEVAAGDTVRKGQQLLVMEAMKMEHVIAAPASGIVESLSVAAGDAVFEGRVLALLTVADDRRHADEAAGAVDLDSIRPDLAEALERHAIGLDDSPAGRGRHSAVRPDTAPRARTSTICSIRDRSSNTGRWWSRRSGAVGRCRI